MRIAYISYNQLMDDIRDNLWKIPRDTDLVLSVPRSGNIIAAVITKYLNVRTLPISVFCDAIKSGFGEEKILSLCSNGTFTSVRESTIKNVLIVDDTIYTGK